MKARPKDSGATRVRLILESLHRGGDSLADLLLLLLSQSLCESLPIDVGVRDAGGNYRAGRESKCPGKVAGKCILRIHDLLRV